jgi:hypothetical protein
MTDVVGIDKLVAAFGGLPGAAVGHGPRHPTSPNPAVADDLTWFFDEQYPGLKADPGYVEFMWRYAGLSRKDEDYHHLFYLYGFGPATADILHDLDEDLADEEGMFTIAECTVDGDIPERPLDSYSMDFGFDLTGSRRPGVYRLESTMQVPRTAWVWHTTDFTTFLSEAVARGGVWPRPQLVPSSAPEGDPLTTTKICRFWQHNRDLRQIFAIVAQAGSPPVPPVAYGPLALEEVREDRYLRPLRGVPAGDPELAAELGRRAAEFHDLEDFYRYAGYSDEIIAWVEATEINTRDALGYIFPGGRVPYDVAEKLGLDPVRLRDAASDESVMPHRVDPEGRNVYYEEFWDNWAVDNESGHLVVNPKSYRFKAWVAFNAERGRG